MGISQSVLDGTCYQYRYDMHNRLAEKKLPGKEWEFIVYNILGQPVITGPITSPLNPHDRGCLFTKYDAYNRICYTGFYMPTGAPTRLALQANYDNITNLFESRTQFQVGAGDISTFYSNSVFPSTGIAVLSVNYYDDYIYGTSLPMPETVYGLSMATNVRGLQTASWQRVVGAPGSVGNWTYTGYDNVKFRPIWSGSHFYNEGYTMVDREFDFSGKILQTLTTHWASRGGEQVIHDVYSYTAQQQPLRHTQQINSKPVELLYLNEYDSLGQLITKKVGGTNTNGSTPYQKIDYRYNIRGWLTDINDRSNLEDDGFRDDLFAFHINYNSVEGEVSGLSPLYNGNISETFWRVLSDNVMRSYGYRYDKLNRLLDAFYQKPGGITDYPESYDEKLQYDMNGNIIWLHRNGNLDSDIGDYLNIDLLSYTYDPIKRNQLKSVSDATNHPAGFMDGANAGDDYEYDAFGNMTLDRNKGITDIAYNHLNLPVKIEFGSPATKIEYLYGAGGQKLQKKVSASGNVTVTDYYGDFQYRNGVLQFIQTPEGYVAYTPSDVSPELGSPGTPESFNYVYHYTDHLGNIRLTYGLDPSAPVTGLKILEENHYYPFGLKHTNYNSGNEQYGRSKTDKVELKPGQQTKDGKIYNYKFQGQERQDELGLNWDSFKWRNYDYAIGRFMVIDPLAPDFPQWSPYVFSGNLVTISKELEGMEPEFLVGSDGKLTSGAVTLMNAAYGYSVSSLTNSTWIISTDSRVRFWNEITGHPEASVKGHLVMYSSKVVNRDDNYWFGLISHEQSHRQDIANQGSLSFYSEYLTEGIANSYKDIPTEAKAFRFGSDNKNEDLADKLLSYKDGAVMSIFQRGNLTNNEKASMLEAVGNQFKRDVVLQGNIDSAKSGLINMKDMNWDAKTKSNTTKLLNSLISNWTKEQEELTKRYGE